MGAPARCLVVMGVCGSGKSAVAAALADRLGLQALDADDLHAPEAVARMRAGIALRDEDRWPWLDRVGQRLRQAAAPPGPGIAVACSALRRIYRDRLRAACPGLRFVFLDGDPALLAARLAAREGHYMPPALLPSQLRTLERPGPDEPDVHRVDIAPPLAAVVAQALAALAAGSLPGAVGPAAAPSHPLRPDPTGACR
jgi:carbohydrate kinase (thermoresistant glucokinase family)